MKAQLLQPAYRVNPPHLKLVWVCCRWMSWCAEWAQEAPSQAREGT